MALTSPASPVWKLEDAEAHFGEVVRLARSEGPQHVAVKGRDSVVVISVEDLDRLTKPEPRQDFLTFMESLPFHPLPLDRDDDRGRDLEL